MHEGVFPKPVQVQVRAELGAGFVVNLEQRRRIQSPGIREEKEIEMGLVTFT